MNGMTPERAKTFLGIQIDHKLSACPETPNCVSSHEPKDSRGYVEPLHYHEDLGAAQEHLKSIVLSLPRAALVEEKNGYLRFEFRTLLFRFVDDIEFLFDAATKEIHVRSASRVGYSDLGANRRRVDVLREQWLLGPHTRQFLSSIPEVLADWGS